MHDCVKHSGVGGEQQQQQQQQQQSPDLIFDIGTNSQPEQRTTNRMLIADIFVRMRPQQMHMQCKINHTLIATAGSSSRNIAECAQ